MCKGVDNASHPPGPDPRRPSNIKSGYEPVNLEMDRLQTVRSSCLDGFLNTIIKFSTSDNSNLAF